MHAHTTYESINIFLAYALFVGVMCRIALKEDPDHEFKPAFKTLLGVVCLFHGPGHITMGCWELSLDPSYSTIISPKAQ